MTVLKSIEKRQAIRSQLYDALKNDGLTISEVFIRLRKILGLNQSDFAAKYKISISTLRRIEQENGNVTIATVKKVLEKFSLKLLVKSAPQ